MQSIKLVDSNTPCLYIRKQGDRQTYIYRYKRNQKKVVHKVGDVGVDNKRDIIKLAREMNLRRSFGMEVIDGTKADDVVITTFGEIFERCVKERKDVAQINVYRNYFKRAKFYDKAINKISHNQIEDFVSKVAIKTPVQSNRLLVVLRTVFRRAINRGFIQHKDNPTIDIKKQTEFKRERYLTQAEWETLRDTIYKYRSTMPEQAIFTLLLALTGCRQGELKQASWDDVEFYESVDDSTTGEAGKITLYQHKTSHTGKARRIFLSPEAVMLFKQLPRSNGKVFSKHINIRKFWNLVRSEAELGDFNMHDLRHNFASLCLRQGKNLSEIGMLLGHSSTNMTARYAHLMDDEAHKAVVGISSELLG